MKVKFDCLPVESALKNPSAVYDRLKKMPIRELSIVELILRLEQGHAIQPVELDYNDDVVRCIGQQVFMFSVPFARFQPKKALQILRDKGIPAVGGYSSFNRKEYTLILVCESEVKDSSERRFIIQYINYLLLQEDKTYSDIDFFFGTNKKFYVCDYNARFKVEDVIKPSTIAELFSCVYNFFEEFAALIKKPVTSYKKLIQEDI